MAPPAPTPAADKTAPPAQNTAKRDFLIQLEQQAQKRWSDEKLFEQNSPYSTGEEEVPTEEFAKHAKEMREKYPKVLATMPYPVSFPTFSLSLTRKLADSPPSKCCIVHEWFSSFGTWFHYFED